MHYDFRGRIIAMRGTSTQDLASLVLIGALVAPSLGACDSSSSGPDPPDDAGVTRTYRMGWAPTPPQPTEESIIETAFAMAEVSELGLLQQHVPWTRILAGERMSDLLAEAEALADFLQGLGLDIVFLVDPLDGLDRRREPPELVDAGRSILEPEIRAIHDEWVLEVARLVRPAYLGLASEINTLGAHGDATLYGAIVDMVNTLAPEIRGISPQTQVFVSFQVDDAWQLLLPSPFDHFALIDDFDIDALGLSSYPVFVFDTPQEIPSNYFGRFQESTSLPLILVEGGWSSTGGPIAQGTPGEQVDFFVRFSELLDTVEAQAWVMLFYADVDVASYGLPPDREATLANFATMGIVDLNLDPKPAFGVWEELFSRPLR